MRLSRSLALVLIAALAAGCASSSPPSGGAPGSDPTQRPEIVERDVVLDGVSLLGVWNAVGALDEPDVDSDLRSGLLIETLVVNPRGLATLTGEDRRAGTGLVTLDGRISGDRLTFDGLPGAALLTVRSDGRILVTDPRGRRTVYERE